MTIKSNTSNATVDRQYLLTSKQMAAFVADGLLRFDELVPTDINEAAQQAFDDQSFPHGGGYIGQRLDGMIASDWADTPLGGMLRMPEVQGIIQSLVGPGPMYDHHAVHKVAAHNEVGQFWHADAIIDTRMAFDIQLFYFCHDTPRQMGGTLFLPGSHYRRVHESDIARYQNFLGQEPTVCKAGTLLVGHHGLWHCAQPNRTDRMRYMFKLRLNPTVRQLRLWNTDDIDDPQITGILGRDHRWYGNENRIEYINRIKMWRFLIGDQKWDMDYWLTRIENEPQQRATA